MSWFNKNKGKSSNTGKYPPPGDAGYQFWWLRNSLFHMIESCPCGIEEGICRRATCDYITMWGHSAMPLFVCPYFASCGETALHDEFMRLYKIEFPHERPKFVGNLSGATGSPFSGGTVLDNPEDQRLSNRIRDAKLTSLDMNKPVVAEMVEFLRDGAIAMVKADKIFERVRPTSPPWNSLSHIPEYKEGWPDTPIEKFIATAWFR